MSRGKGGGGGRGGGGVGGRGGEQGDQAPADSSAAGEMVTQTADLQLRGSLLRFSLQHTVRATRFLRNALSHRSSLLPSQAASAPVRQGRVPPAPGAHLAVLKLLARFAPRRGDELEGVADCFERRERILSLRDNLQRRVEGAQRRGEGEEEEEEGRGGV
eukprot:749514-Hanusia_phi.AAC.1